MSTPKKQKEQILHKMKLLEPHMTEEEVAVVREKFKMMASLTGQGLEAEGKAKGLEAMKFLDDIEDREKYGSDKDNRCKKHKLKPKCHEDKENQCLWTDLGDDDYQTTYNMLPKNSYLRQHVASEKGADTLENFIEIIHEYGHECVSGNDRNLWMGDELTKLLQDRAGIGEGGSPSARVAVAAAEMAPGAGQGGGKVPKKRKYTKKKKKKRSSKKSTKKNNTKVSKKTKQSRKKKVKSGGIVANMISADDIIRKSTILSPFITSDKKLNENYIDNVVQKRVENIINNMVVGPENPTPINLKIQELISSHLELALKSEKNNLLVNNFIAEKFGILSMKFKKDV